MILGIETATSSCSVAIYDEELKKIIASKTVVDKNIHSEKMLEFLDEIIIASKIKLEQINKIAVSIGPGSFTGLRIGLSAAKGLAMALQIPIICIPTLDGLVFSFLNSNSENKFKKIIAMIPAKREEAYFSTYNSDKIIDRCSPYEIKPIIDILNLQNDTKFIIAKEWNHSNNFHSKVINFINCSAESIACLAATGNYLAHSEFDEIEPMYIRDFEPKIK